MYDEGLGGRVRRARIGRHLAGCQRCARTRGQLVAVTSLLASTTAPAMPDELAQRVQLAIAHEAAARSTGQAADAAARAGTEVAGAATAPASGRPAPGRSGLPRRSRAGWFAGSPMPSAGRPVALRVATALGVAAVLAGGGYLIVSGRTTPAGSEAGTTSNSPVSAPRPSVLPKGSAAAGLSEPAVADWVVTYRRAGRTATASVLASGRDYTPRTLSSQVRLRVANSPATVVPGPTYGPLWKLPGISVSHLAGCLTRIAAGRKVLVADVARFAGTPAVIIVLRPATATAVYDVSVVGLACSASTSDVIRTVVVTSARTGG